MTNYLQVLVRMARKGVTLVNILIMISYRCSSQARKLLLLLISCLKIDIKLGERWSARMIAQLTRPVSDAVIPDLDQSLPITLIYSL